MDSNNFDLAYTKLLHSLRSNYPQVPLSFVESAVQKYGGNVDVCFREVGAENERLFRRSKESLNAATNGFGPTGPSLLASSPTRQRSVSVPCHDAGTPSPLSPAPQQPISGYYAWSQSPSSPYATITSVTRRIGAGSYVVRTSPGNVNISSSTASIRSAGQPRTGSPINLAKSKAGYRLVIKRSSQSDEERADSPSTSTFNPSFQVIPVNSSNANPEAIRLVRPRHLSVDKVSAVGLDETAQRSRSVVSSPVTHGAWSVQPQFPPGLYWQRRADLVSVDPTRRGSSPSSPVFTRRQPPHLMFQSGGYSGSVPSLTTMSSTEDTPPFSPLQDRPSPLLPSQSFSLVHTSSGQPQHPSVQRQHSRVVFTPSSQQMPRVPSGNIVVQSPTHETIRIGVAGRNSPQFGIIQRKHAQAGAPVSPLSVVINSPTCSSPPVLYEQPQRRPSYPLGYSEQAVSPSALSQQRFNLAGVQPSSSTQFVHEVASRSQSISGSVSPVVTASNFGHYGRPLHIQTQPNSFNLSESPYQLQIDSQQRNSVSGASPSPGGGIKISFASRNSTSAGLVMNIGGMRGSQGGGVQIGQGATINFGPRAQVQQLAHVARCYPHELEQPIAPSQDYINTLIGHQEAQKGKMANALESVRARCAELGSDVTEMEKHSVKQRKHSLSKSTVNEETVTSLHDETRKLQAEVQLMLKEVDVLRQARSQEVKLERTKSQKQHPSSSKTKPKLNAAVASVVKTHKKSVIGRIANKLISGQPPSEEVLRRFSLDRRNSRSDSVNSGGCGARGDSVEKTDAEAALDGDTEPWSCSACTFQNASGMTYCEMCEMPHVKEVEEGWQYVMDISPTS